MKKIGLVTVYGEQNYGNKLQNYALIQIYKINGYDATTIQVFQSALIPSLKQRIKNFAKAFLAIIGSKSVHAQFYRREQSFRKFSKEYLNLSKKYNTKNVKKEFLKTFDVLSVGSDQVWNDSDFNLDDVRYYSLYGIDKIKKISFAASIGKSDFKKEYEKQFAAGLSNFDFISCREKSAVFYLSSLLNKSCFLLMDPTLFLSRSEWIKIEKKPKWLKDSSYILLYFLGGNNPRLKEKCVGDNYIIDLLDPQSEAYLSSPCEFIYLVHHAEEILTDSFHACVFSMIFKKNFTVFDRIYSLSNMNSRIDTLFEEFSVDGHIGEMITPEKYSSFQDIVMNKRKEYTKLLMKALNN